MQIPLRWRRHWKLVAGFVVAVAATVGFAGNERVTAITSSERGAAGATAEPAGLDLAGTLDVFDRDHVHEIAIEFAQADYRRMLNTFSSTGTKEFIDATVTIDGTRIENVGLRLKGNSTLRGLGGFGGGRGFGGGSDSSTADDPRTLPWLVELDTFVENRRYEGYETLAIRPAGNIGYSTALNEALATALIADVGEPAVRFSYASVTINGGEPVLRLVLEEPDSKLAEDTFANEGVLYKSLSSGRFEYRGETAIAYDDSFRQITRKKRQDLKPLINLLGWVTNASDEEFDADLAEHVDVGSFARYVALQNLLLNFDDMAGPGQNYYLWYDLEDERFRVVTWDLNFSLSGDTAQGPFDQGRFGGQGFGGGPRGGFGGNLPSAGGGGGVPPFGDGPPDGAQGGAPRGFGGPGAGPRGGNLLKERFLESGAFRDVYLGEYRKLYDRLYTSGHALRELEQLQDVLSASDTIDAATLDGEVNELRSTIRTRRTELASVLAKLD
jgi:spore coat protein CotH